MEYYLINEILTPCTWKELKESGRQYVALLSLEEWMRERDSFDLGIDLEPVPEEIHTTKAEVNYDSLTGTFCIPDRNNLTGADHKFAFALDEKGIIFIDDTGTAVKYIQAIRRTKKWKKPGLERFLYDFLEQIVRKDHALMERMEKELYQLELVIMDESSESDTSMERMNVIRGEIRELREHYEQLMDFTQELEENENSFFAQENLRYFKLSMNRIQRLIDVSSSVRDYTMQLRDLHKTYLDQKQNRIMTILTVVTTIFMPLTLITGWYGMNFNNMPELTSPWGYKSVILISLVIVIGSLIFFRKKKWL